MPEPLSLTFSNIPEAPGFPMLRPMHLPLKNILKSHLFTYVSTHQGICREHNSEHSFRESVLSFLM